MNPIKVILVLSVLGLFFWAVRNRHRVGLRAGARVGMVVVALLAIAAVIQPEVTQWAADQVGVTRGTDLVLYLSIVVFAGISIAQHLRIRDLEDRFTSLVRSAALQDAGSLPLRDASPRA